MNHIFISFVEENANLASWVADQMRGNGLEPWFAKDEGRIAVGDQWKSALRAAIREGGFYVPLFTKEWAARRSTVANEELVVAIDEARKRGLTRRWFVPVKVDDADLPNWDLGAGIELADLHYADMPRLGWERGLRDLLQALGVEHPIIKAGEPIAPGFGANIRIAGGYVTYRNVKPAVPTLEGVSFTVTGGFIHRTEDGELYAQFKLRAPFEQLQQLNEQLGLDGIDVLANSRVISTDPDAPTDFYFVDEKDRQPPGGYGWTLGMKEPIRIPVSTEQQTGYTARGYIDRNNRLAGTFDGYVETRTPFGGMRVKFDGNFEMTLVAAIEPPAN